MTINTNRQNPVEPANLRASDPIQLELQDKFRDELNGSALRAAGEALRELVRGGDDRAGVRPEPEPRDRD